MQISRNFVHHYDRLFTSGLSLSFFVYVFVNAGMVSGILPIIGIPLPFLNYSGTAMITLMAAFSVVMLIHTHK